MILPSVLVTDTNIWIDLAKGKVLSEVFRLPYEFLTTDFAVDELKNPCWSALHTLGLEVQCLDPEGILELARLRQIHRSLSAVDLAAFLLARQLGATLVTGDRRLNDLASAHGVPVHGILWILDEMVSLRVLTPCRAAESLRRMLELGARLPEGECRKRFENWST